MCLEEDSDEASIQNPNKVYIYSSGCASGCEHENEATQALLWLKMVKSQSLRAVYGLHMRPHMLLATLWVLECGPHTMPHNPLVGLCGHCTA